MSEQPTWQDIEAILSDPTSLQFAALRDRATYVHLTGTMPSHLRVPSTRRLVLIAPLSNSPPDIEGAGSFRVDERVVRPMDLNHHPMAVKVRQLADQGYRLRVSLGPNERKPYSKVFLHKGDHRCTVNIDGSVLDGWG